MSINANMLVYGIRSGKNVETEQSTLDPTCHGINIYTRSIDRCTVHTENNG